MINRLKYRLNSTKFKGASNTDSYFNVNLESKNKLLPPGEISRTVNTGDIFDKERDESKVYRIIQTLSPLFTNVLFNLSGDKGPNNYFISISIIQSIESKNNDKLENKYYNINDLNK